MIDLKPLRLGSLVRIEWDDASSHDEGWVEAKELKNRVQKCTTVGFVVRKDRKQVLLAMSTGKHPADGKVQYATTWAIPLGWITNVGGLTT